MMAAYITKNPFRKRLLYSSRNAFSTTGFTLIEVVITLTILGFICLIIFGAFRLGLSAWERGDSVKEEYQKVCQTYQQGTAASLALDATNAGVNADYASWHIALLEELAPTGWGPLLAGQRNQLVAS